MKKTKKTIEKNKNKKEKKESNIRKRRRVKNWRDAVQEKITKKKEEKVNGIEKF